MDANSSASTAAPYVGRCPENSLTCVRILSPAEVLVIAIDVPVLLFHASVFYFILRQIMGTKQDFRSAFYRLYAAMSAVDVIHVIDVCCVEFTSSHLQRWLRLGALMVRRQFPSDHKFSKRFRFQKAADGHCQFYYN